MDGDYAPIILVFYLFAIFSAYWAQETGRSPLLWFFLGLFFAPFTGLSLLSKNSAEASTQSAAEVT
ncbi:MAG: hypothetical protein IH968_18645 [Gemmatimonadetes bacterium]|nr:hypothetical protein [Gemmatimonadota bacterium]